MGKVVKGIIIGIVVVVAFYYVGVAVGLYAAPGTAAGGLAGTGPFAGLFGLGGAAAAAVGGGIMGGLSALLAPRATLEEIRARGRVSVNPDAPMKWVFGHTAMATDAVWAGKHGQSDQFYSFVIAGAGHQIYSFDAGMFIDGDPVTFTGDAADGDYAGVLWRQTRIGTEAQAAYSDIDAPDYFVVGGPWSSDAEGAGMAHIRLRWAVDEKKIASGVPTRVTQGVRGCLVYDPRLDSSIGGSGTHLAADQTTWSYIDGSKNIGENWALLVLWYLLGWKINGKLIIGMGIDPADIDMDQAIAAANACESIDPITGRWRYKIGGILAVTNDHEATIGQLEAAINGKIGFVGGKYYIWAPNDDLTPFSSITEGDLLRDAGVHYTPSGPMELLYNTIRGRFVDPSDEGVYQLMPYPEVDEPTAIAEDEMIRLEQMDFALIQEEYIAQRVARQFLRRSRFGATWRFAMGPKGLTFQPFTVTTLNIQETNYTDELVRIISLSYSASGIVIVECIEEDSSIYDLTEPLGTTMVTTPIGAANPLEEIILTGLTATEHSFTGDLGTALDGFIVTWDDPGGNVGSTHVQFKRTVDVYWINVPTVQKDDLEAYIYPVEPGTTYDIRARHISRWGVAGPFQTIQKLSGTYTTLGGDTLFDSNDWVDPIATPMGGWVLSFGSITNSSMSVNTLGPFLMLPKVVTIKGNGTAPGYYSRWRHPITTDDNNSYLVYEWVRRRTTATNIGLYSLWEGTTQSLGTHGDQLNAAILSNIGSLMVVGDWYLMVSILHPSGYTGADIGIAGLYDPKDGSRIYDGSEYHVKPGETSISYAFAFYSATTPFTSSDGFEFCRPVAYIINGKEPTIETALNLAAVTGKSIIVANAYLRKISVPAQPPNDSGAYDFSNQILTPPNTTNPPIAADDWSASIPAVDGNPLYVISGTFEIDGDTGTDETVVWSPPALLISDGTDGDAIVVVNAYLRKGSIPTKPPDDAGSYDFDNLVLEPPSTSTSPAAADNWFAEPPEADGNPLYVISGTFSRPGGTGIDQSVVWTTPKILTSDGISPSVYYIRALTGTAIKNNIGNILLEAREIIDGVDSLIVTPNPIQLYKEPITPEGYELNYDHTDILGSIIITLKDAATGGTTYDSKTLMDLSDGAAAMQGYTSSSGPLTWVKDKNSGAWNPVATSVDVYVWFSKGGVVYGRIARRILRAADGALTHEYVVHPDGDWDPLGSISRTVLGSGNTMTLSYEYNGVDGIANTNTHLSAVEGGDQGDPGDNAEWYYIKPSDGLVIHNSTGTLTIGARHVVDGVDSLLTSGTIKLYEGTTDRGYAYTYDAASINGSVLVELRDGPAGQRYDSMTLVDITDGAHGIAVILTNEAHSFPVDGDETVTYVGSGTDIQVWIGTTPIPYDITSADGYDSPSFRVSISASPNITPGSFSYPSANVISCGAAGSTLHSALLSNTASITYSIIVKDNEGVETTFTKEQTFSISHEGDAGIDSIGAALSNPSPVVPCDLEGFNYPIYLNVRSFVDGTSGVFQVVQGETDITGTINDMYLQNSGDGWVTSGQVQYKTIDGARIEIDRDTGAYIVSLPTVPAYRSWTAESVSSALIQVTVAGTTYTRAFSVSKANSSNALSVAIKIAKISAYSITAATATVRFDNNGYIYSKINTGSYVQGNQWLLQGFNYEYSVKAIVSVGDSNLISGTLNTFLDMATDRTFTLTSGGGIDQVTLEFEIQRDSSSEVIKTGYSLLEAHYDTT